jgi:hypothetical protein
VKSKSKSKKAIINNTISTTSSNYILDIDKENSRSKIENITEGLSANCFNFLYNRILPASEGNALTICDYISSMKSEINLVDH